MEQRAIHFRQLRIAAVGRVHGLLPADHLAVLRIDEQRNPGRATGNFDHPRGELLFTWGAGHAQFYGTQRPSHSLAAHVREHARKVHSQWMSGSIREIATAAERPTRRAEPEREITPALLPSASGELFAS